MKKETKKKLTAEFSAEERKQLEQKRDEVAFALLSLAKLFLNYKSDEKFLKKVQELLKSVDTDEQNNA